jgi:hypothetical protein
MTDFVINPHNAKTTIDGSVDTIIHVVLDGSSSMSSIKPGTLSGLNEYLKGLPRSTENSRTLISITQFDTSHQMTAGASINDDGLRLRPIRSYVDINEVAEIGDHEYQPSGSTPLLDAIANLVEETNAVANTSPTPPAVMVVIVTDGHENTSRRQTKETIKALIEKKTNEDKWTFVYLGANQDSFGEASSYGIAAGNTVNFKAGAIHEAFLTASAVGATYTSTNSVTRSTHGKMAKYVTSDSFAEAGLDNSKVIDKS